MKLFTQMSVLILMIGSHGVVPALAMDPTPQSPKIHKELHSTSPSAAARYANVEGTLREIKGDMFILEGASAEQQIKIQVGKDTAFPNGQKELGQNVQALVSTQDGHALIIR